MEILAIIPARGGSKGIHKKNIRLLNNKPLIVHTINAAKNSKLITKLIVSTDDKKIASISKKYSAEIPFMRPKKLSRDNSSLSDVISHSLQYLEKKENYIPDIIIILQPTSPLRTSEKIDSSILSLKRSKADSVISVCIPRNHPYRSFLIDNHYLKPLRKDFKKYYQRQLLPKIYSPTGEIYAFWIETWKKYKSYYGKSMKPLLPKKNEIILDIDNETDFFVCESILKNRIKLSKF